VDFGQAVGPVTTRELGANVGDGLLSPKAGGRRVLQHRNVFKIPLSLTWTDKRSWDDPFQSFSDMTSRRQRERRVHGCDRNGQRVGPATLVLSDRREVGVITPNPVEFGNVLPDRPHASVNIKNNFAVAVDVTRRSAATANRTSSIKAAWAALKSFRR
jgi:hypothetical protein